jgi:phospholipase C
MSQPFALRHAIMTCALLCLAACSLGQQSTSPVSAVPFVGQNELARHFRSSGKIQHIIIIVQENRSFDNLFQGYPGADTVSSGKNSKGQTITLQPVPLSRQYVIDHSNTSMFHACDAQGSLPGTDCKMDGFDQEPAYGGPTNPQYVYTPLSDSQPYFDMAHEGVLADRMFQSHLDESFISHQYIIAAQAHSGVNLPGGYWGCDGGPSDMVQTITQQRTIGKPERACFNYNTLGDELDKAGLPWRFYTSTINNDGGEWSGYQAIKHIRYGPDWGNDVITPQKNFITDVKAGTLASVTWITPICANSDHVNCGGGTGPEWVASLVNAVGESPFWGTSAIFITWDDWGGLYDHVPPPFVDYDGLGFRVPLVIMSPYAKTNSVSHVQYEPASVLRFAEDQFGLARLAQRDANANSPENDSFDFKQKPHAFVRIKTPKHSLDFYMTQPADGRPPDDQ